MNFLYSEVKAAGDFVFRHAPEQRVLFVPLRQAVAPKRARSSLVVATETDVAETETHAAGDSPPSGVAPGGEAEIRAARVKEGFRGGSPFSDEE